MCEWKELVLCSPSSYLRQVKPNVGKTGELSKFFDLEKAEHPQIDCEIAHQGTDATSPVGRIVRLLPWYVSLCPVDFVKTPHSNTLLPEPAAGRSKSSSRRRSVQPLACLTCHRPCRCLSHWAPALFHLPRVQRPDSSRHSSGAARRLVMASMFPRGILWYSRHVSFFLDLELLFMS